MQEKQEQRLSSSFREDYFLYLIMAIGGLSWTGPGQGKTQAQRHRDTTGVGPMHTVEAVTD